MKYWRKYLKEKTERLEKSYELLAETGYCGGLLCCNCPFMNSNGGKCNAPDTRGEIVEALNREVEDD